MCHFGMFGYVGYMKIIRKWNLKVIKTYLLLFYTVKMSWVILELIVVKCAVLGVCLAMLDISEWSLDQHLFITWIWSLNSQGVVWPFFGIWAPVGPYLYPTPHATNRNSPTQSFINNSPPCHGFFAMAGGFLRYNVYIYIYAYVFWLQIANFVLKIFSKKFSNQGSGMVPLDSQGFKPSI